MTFRQRITDPRTRFAVSAIVVFVPFILPALVTGTLLGWGAGLRWWLVLTCLVHLVLSDVVTMGLWQATLARQRRVEAALAADLQEFSADPRAAAPAAADPSRSRS